MEKMMFHNRSTLTHVKTKADHIFQKQQNTKNSLLKTRLSDFALAFHLEVPKAKLANVPKKKIIKTTTQLNIRSSQHLIIIQIFFLISVNR